MQYVSRDRPNQEQMTAAEQLEYLIQEYVVGKKAYRDREILTCALIHGYSYEKIEEETGISVSTIGRVVRKYGDWLLCKVK